MFAYSLRSTSTSEGGKIRREVNGVKDVHVATSSGTAYVRLRFLVKAKARTKCSLSRVFASHEATTKHGGVPDKKKKTKTDLRIHTA